MSQKEGLKNPLEPFDDSVKANFHFAKIAFEVHVGKKVFANAYGQKGIEQIVNVDGGIKRR
jgi:hypothetical protein